MGLPNAATSFHGSRREHLRILGNELFPQFAHHPLNVLRLVMIAVGELVAKLTQADNAGTRITGSGTKAASVGLCYALRRDVELIARD